MKKLLSFAFFWFVSSTVVAENSPVDAAGVAAMGQVINSVPQHNCMPIEAVYKGSISGRVYVLTHCQSGASFAVHFLPDGTDTRVTDCAVSKLCADLSSVQ